MQIQDLFCVSMAVLVVTSVTVGNENFRPVMSPTTIKFHFHCVSILVLLLDRPPL